MLSRGGELRVFQPEQSESLSRTGQFSFDVSELVASLFLPNGQFVGYLNEPNIAGWSSALRQNYGPVLARYIKLDGFSFKVRFYVSESHLQLMHHAAGVWRCEYRMRQRRFWDAQHARRNHRQRAIIIRVNISTMSVHLPDLAFDWNALLHLFLRSHLQCSMLVSPKFAGVHGEKTYQLQLAHPCSNSTLHWGSLCVPKRRHQPKLSIFHLKSKFSAKNFVSVFAIWSD